MPPVEKGNKGAEVEEDLSEAGGIFVERFLFWWKGWRLGTGFHDFLLGGGGGLFQFFFGNF